MIAVYQRAFKKKILSDAQLAQSVEHETLKKKLIKTGDFFCAAILIFEDGRKYVTFFAYLYFITSRKVNATEMQ